MSDMDEKRRSLLICVGLAALTFAVFSPVLSCEFVNYDDPYYVVQNPYIQHGFTWAGVKWAFTASYASNWHPLTWLSHMLDVQLYGLNPAGHHLTNLLLHAANTVLLFLLLNKMLRAPWRCAIVAALFAWHPLHVESVAWVAERKDVLSTCLGLLSLWAYVSYTEASKARAATARGWYAAALALFALGLLAKPMLVTLPCVLLLLDFWPLRRLPAGLPFFGPAPVSAGTNPQNTALPPEPSFSLGRLLGEKLPWLALSAISSVLTVWAQANAVVPITHMPLLVRWCNVLFSYARYLVKAVWPHHLVVHYPYLRFWSLPHLLVVALGLGLLTWFALRSVRRRPYLFTGWFWFLGTLVPVIGLVQVGAQAMADRYSYFPLIGIFLMVVWGSCELAQRFGVPTRALGVTAALVLTLCLPLTWQQLSFWRNSIALFEHTVSLTTDNYMMLYNLGFSLAEKGDLKRAEETYRQALQIVPDYAEAQNGLAKVLMMDQQLEEALVHYRTAVRLSPRSAYFQHNLGLGLAAAGHFDEAVTSFAKALELNPGDSLAHKDMALALEEKGDHQGALTHLREYLRFAPNDPEGQLRLGYLLMKTGDTAAGQQAYATALSLQPDMYERVQEAAAMFSKSGKTNAALFCYQSLVYLRPDNAGGHEQLGLFLAQQGRIAEALPHFEQVLQARPDAQAHYNLALAASIQHDTPAAVRHLRAALEYAPDWTLALNDLAWQLATSPQDQLRNGTEAVQLAEKACKLSADEPRFWGTLDAAYAAAGRFDEARTTAQKTHDLAQAAGQKEVAEAAQQRLELYRTQQPFRAK